MTKLTNRLETLFQPLLDSLGLSLVRVLLMGKKKMTLQVMIERKDFEPLSMDECVHASRKISELLDHEDPIEVSYGLEVTSPGIDRPLLKPVDFQRFVGETIQVTLLAPVGTEGRKHAGLLKEATDDDFELLKTDKTLLKIAYKDLGQAKLDPQFNFNKKG